MNYSQITVLSSLNVLCVVCTCVWCVFVDLSVVEDDYGVSKGYGFVRFSEEYERDRALEEMDGAYGLGLRPIRVKQAQAPKHK